MTAALAQTAIESHFASGFTACAIKYQNVDFNPDDHDVYAELQVQEGSSSHASIGPSPLHRALGIISINFHALPDTGTVGAIALADQSAAVFRDVIFSGIVCRSPVIRVMGPREGRYVVNMTISYFRDEIF